MHCCVVSEDASYAYIHCTQDGWHTVSRTLADMNDGAGQCDSRKRHCVDNDGLCHEMLLPFSSLLLAAIVEITVAPRVCTGGDAYLAVGGYVTGTGQSPVWYRSCDQGATWTKDPAPVMPVAGLLNTDVDCQGAAPNGTQCWTTLWDDGGLDSQGYVARYFSQ
jgi:hypothetical protein